MIMLREIRVYLGFRLDIFEDWFLLVEREKNNVQKSQINLRGDSKFDKTAPVGLGSLAIFFCSSIGGTTISNSFKIEVVRFVNIPPWVAEESKICCIGTNW